MLIAAAWCLLQAVIGVSIIVVLLRDLCTPKEETARGLAVPLEEHVV